jgi:hypothetical protein
MVWDITFVPRSDSGNLNQTPRSIWPQWNK